MAAARPDCLRPDAPPAGRSAAALLPDHVEPLDTGQVVAALEAHQHGPGVVRDTVLCAACAATVEDRDLETRQA
jgi:hypothetical protein